MNPGYKTMKIIPILLASLLVALPVPGISETVLIGKDRLFIGIPDGYCPLVKSNPSDRRLIRFLEEGNRNMNLVLITFADCKQLVAWRKGTKANLDDYGYVLAPVNLANRKLQMSVRDFVAEMRKVLNKQFMDTHMEQALDNIESVVKKNFPTAELNQTRNLGVIAEDEKALYLGILQNVTAENGETKNMLGMWGVTLVSGKAVNLYLWKKYHGDGAARETEALIKSWMAKVHGGT